MTIYGEIAKERAKRLYDAYVHLPVEFPMTADGHRPVSEPFRTLSDHLLIETLEDLGIEYHGVGGSIRERLEKIIQIFSLPLVVPLDQAIAEGERRAADARAILEDDERVKEAQRKKSTGPRVGYALRY